MREMPSAEPRPLAYEPLAGTPLRRRLFRALLVALLALVLAAWPATRFYGMHLLVQVDWVWGRTAVMMHPELACGPTGLHLGLGLLRRTYDPGQELLRYVGEGTDRSKHPKVTVNFTGGRLRPPPVPKRVDMLVVQDFSPCHRKLEISAAGVRMRHFSRGWERSSTPGARASSGTQLDVPGWLLALISLGGGALLFRRFRRRRRNRSGQSPSQSLVLESLGDARDLRG